MHEMMKKNFAVTDNVSKFVGGNLSSTTNL